METKFTKYWQKLKPENKQVLADDLSTSVAYLSQIANGHRNAGASILLTIESATSGEIKPEDIRPLVA